jgi:hypothetical protein
MRCMGSSRRWPFAPTRPQPLRRGDGLEGCVKVVEQKDAKGAKAFRPPALRFLCVLLSSVCDGHAPFGAWARLGPKPVGASAGRTSHRLHSLVPSGQTLRLIRGIQDREAYKPRSTQVRPSRTQSNLAQPNRTGLSGKFPDIPAGSGCMEEAGSCFPQWRTLGFFD